MSTGDNKAIVGRWFDPFWGPDFDPAVIGELAARDIRFEYSPHAACRAREEVRRFAEEIGLDDGVAVIQQLDLIPQE